MFQHFLEAQEDTYGRALAELASGHKRSHWMWFIFPQIAGLGHSPMAQRFAIKDIKEAQAYLAHDVLGPRLRRSVKAVMPHAGSLTAHVIFGTPDDLKFRSSMTLFAAANPDEPLFYDAIDRFYGGVEDPETLKRLSISASSQ